MRRLPFAVLLLGLLPLACAHVVPPDNDSPLQTAGGASGTAGEGGQAGGTTAGGQGGTGAGTGGVSGKGGTGGTGGKAGGAGGTTGGAGGTPGGAGGDQAGAGGSPLSGCGDKTVKINEFAVAGPKGANDEFIELYNGGTCAVSLDKWVIKYSSKSGSSPSNRWTGTSKDSIESGAFFVLGTSDFAGAKDVTLMEGMSGDGGGIGLYSTDSSKTPLDSVAWKSATASNPMAEGDPCENPDDSHSAARHHDGEDTDDNSADFDASASPSPGQPN